MAESDAIALMHLFYYRRILDSQSLALLYRSYRPLSRLMTATERELKSLMARHYQLRGYVDASQIIRHRVSAARYAEKMLGIVQQGLGGALLTDQHPRFPERLWRSRFPIHWIFCFPQRRLDWPSPIVAIVGSRRSSKQQLDAAREVASAVGLVRGTVLTGLATGADAAAHDEARDSEASIIAVLGNGALKPYPPAHSGWVRELLTGRGTLLTEVPPDYAPHADSFVLRNRIVAALADVVVAVSGKYTSGTAHTLRFASDSGTPIVSVDPAADSGISKLATELGGAVTTAREFARTVGH